MASGRFLDPLTLLRLAPAITAAASVTFSGNQQWIVSILLRDEFLCRSSSSSSESEEERFRDPEAVRAWLDVFFGLARTKVTGLLGASILGAAGNVWFAGDDRGQKWWYGAGLVLAVGSLGMGRVMGRRAGEVVGKGNKNGDGKVVVMVEGVRRWLRVNAVRSLTVDLGAWVCFVVAAVKALQPL
ncbi:hypothetical protein QBC47DRAFT_404878 [Echria macrotheca]|uniref:Uncharacterized protein n=1 Tax=Echria macrotheca TaxID=438768 RepID=A0AAJ0B6F7_9PEZI|nr:hypothetical protein QBC47DRAFT_404878 [Echria macrotheca]